MKCGKSLVNGQLYDDAEKHYHAIREGKGLDELQLIPIKSNMNDVTNLRLKWLESKEF